MPAGSAVNAALPAVLRSDFGAAGPWRAYWPFRQLQTLRRDSDSSLRDAAVAALDRQRESLPRGQPVTQLLSRQDWLGLCTASRGLVSACGGVEAAAAACRVGKSQLGRYQSPHDQEMLPIDVVAALERATGLWPVTTALARLSGHALVQLHAEPGAPELLLRLGDLMRRTGEACAEGAAAMADGQLTEQERAGLSVRLHDTLTVASSLMAWLSQAGRTVPASEAGTPA